MTHNTAQTLQNDDYHDIAHQVISELSDMDVRPVPACYEGWFHYRTNLNKDLSGAIDHIIKRYGIIREIDFENIKKEIEHKDLSVEKFSAAIQDLFSHVTGLEECRNLLSGSTEALNKQVVHTRTQLADPVITISKVREVIKQFSTALKKVETKNQFLEEKLNNSFLQIETLKDSLSSFKKQVHTDALTGVFNRRYFDQCLENEVKLVNQGKARVTILVVDIDFFKSFNDKHGHDTGDQVIRYTAQVLSRNSRPTDILSRYGGDEFVIMLRDTDLSGGKAYGDLFCKKISEKRLKSRVTNSDLGRLTVTIGGTEIVTGDSPETSFRRADNALLQAKRAGRNRALLV